MKRLVAFTILLDSSLVFPVGCGQGSSSSSPSLSKPEEVQIPTIPPEVQRQLGMKPAPAAPPAQKAK